jgi:serine/threonine-protein kinase
LIGQRLSHYTVLAEVGSGGMGVVYRARDEHLNREVALKVLARDLVRDEPSRRRLRIEAEALSRLSHANVATIHDFDSVAGVDFLVMELIPGVTLADRLVAGPIPEPELLGLAVQMAEGLAAAHGMGIVHRDLKPANLRVTPEGRLKVLDFGLAKIAHELVSSGGSALTQIHTLLGTPPYMAPEQLAGGSVDARTDLFAAGVVLYEAATGRRPFEAPQPAAVMAAILNDPVRPPREVNPRVSRQLECIILRCLQKDPTSRYQSARELLEDLRRARAGAGLAAGDRESGGARPRSRRWIVGAALLGLGVLGTAFLLVIGRVRLPGAAGAGVASIAVLPLANLSADPAQEFFAEGMTDELITSLAQIAALKVISRTSVMRYKDTRKTVPQIARELNVDAVLVGSVVRAGERVRINAQLVEARGDRTLWARSYEHDLRDVLALQGEVAGAVSSEIRVRLTPEEKTRLTAAKLVNPVAYPLYLRGRQEWNRRTAQGLRSAIDYFQQALRHDPTYARAYAGLADAYGALGTQAFAPPASIYPQAKAAALKALELEPGLGEAHASLGNVLQNFEWNWTAAEREYRRAIELNPGDATSHQWLGMLLAQKGDFEQSLREVRRAEELDPLSMPVRISVGGCLYFAGRYDEAIEQYRRAEFLEPGFAPLYRALAGAYDRKGMPREAADALARGCLVAGDTVFAGVVRHAFAAGGTEGMVELLARAFIARRGQGYFPASHIAELYARAGRKDEAFRWLETAVRERDVDVNRLKTDPIFESLRQDDRYHVLLRRMGLEGAPGAS